MILKASCVHRNEPVRLVSTTAFHCSTLRSSRRPAAPIPALLNRRSRRPNALLVCAKRARPARAQFGRRAARSGASWGAALGAREERMGRIVYAAAMSHVLYPDYYGQNVGPHGRQMVEALITVVREMGQTLAAAAPDALVVNADDHLTGFSFDAIPAFSA